MSIDDTIIQNRSLELGQSQGDRTAKELADHFVDIDEREPEETLLFVKALAEAVNYYNDRDPQASPKSWEPFFPYSSEAEAKALFEKETGDVPPHLGLLGAFLALYELPREYLNRFAERHLDFHFRRVLHFERRPAEPDHAHVIFELKKNMKPLRILPEMLLSAGKDAKGVERIYKPVREAVVSHAKVEEMRAVFVDDKVHIGPIANSADGLGEPLSPGQTSWAPFGGTFFKVGLVGFAFSSSVLRMKEGTRTITLLLRMTNPLPEKMPLDNMSFEAFLTGEKSWLGPYDVTVERASSDVLKLRITIDAAAKAVVDHVPAVHNGAFGAESPVLQILLKQQAHVNYRQLRGLSLNKASISVTVSDVLSLALESDMGPLDPKKVFFPFGSEPIKGSRFMIGYAEALSKRLTALSLSIQWYGLPEGSVASNYKASDEPISDADLTVTAVFQDNDAESSIPNLCLFGEDDDKAGYLDLMPQAGDVQAKKKATNSELELEKGSRKVSVSAKPSGFPPISDMNRIHALGTAGSMRAVRVGRGLARIKPMLATFLNVAPTVGKSGFITLTLERGFGHAEYQKKILEVSLTKPPQMTEVQLQALVVAAEGVLPMSTELPAIPEKPYTPAIQRISLSYTATTSEVEIDSPDEKSFANPDLRFFHVDGEGQRQEHGYLRHGLDYVEQNVPLFPPHDDEGELQIGLSGVGPGDSVSLLFEVAIGSSDPVFEWPNVKWSVLCDNHWKPLGPGELALDTTNALRRSGLLVVVIPSQATTENTILPTGRIWLKATAEINATAVNRLFEVIPNGVEVRFVDQNNDAGHLKAPLAANTIKKLKVPVPAVKTVQQPMASFGGRPIETDEVLKKRAAERLRHKNRCVTPWDYERIVLEAFPSLHRVQCIPHAKKGSFLAPGHVLLVVVPSLHNANARNPLQPKVEPDVLKDIADYVTARAGAGVTIDVQNPTYQKIRVHFKVKLAPGCAFNTYRPALVEEIIGFLSPWVRQDGRELTFGGQIYKSVLIDFIEKMHYVDYVENFKMFSYVESLVNALDVSEATTNRPDAILVSDNEHIVEKA